jgi:hypothetical protein
VIGILMDTFVVRTVLVPCTCVLLGRWNWWPSKLTIDSPEAESVSAPADALGLAGSQGSAGPDAEVSSSVTPDSAGRPGDDHSLD